MKFKPKLQPRAKPNRMNAPRKEKKMGKAKSEDKASHRSYLSTACTGDSGSTGKAGAPSTGVIGGEEKSPRRDTNVEQQQGIV